ncbi:Xaa-Pro aminopeptidase [Halomicronema hongdechloris C2206]|uniref:Xaa-Pro aminopeptidase n=1 Tax=Halomicronema hongdechloris C2206 TaxID=1641165 RepID=A0A1Z3HNN3_9CYAN|nr:aminopeptidase P family protein [Halomicronema hongdechloris]ASC71885.1 Xaa-Pro aminopeptidase [Halomicronema hongdechloris C2206]
MHGLHFSLAETLRQRRRRLAAFIDGPIALWAGQPPSRNFPANTFPFRASSHFLYFTGLPLAQGVILLQQGRLTLFLDDASPEEVLWHGPSPGRDDIAVQIGADAAYPLADLAPRVQGAATIAACNPAVLAQQEQILGRPVPTSTQATDPDRQLAAAMVQVRLCHDEDAIAQIREAAAVSVAAHEAGMVATPWATSAAEVRAAMERIILAHNMDCAYASIVTPHHGEVLHNQQYHQRLQPGHLLLADVGAEAPSRLASDITLTWPVSGHFSPTQRAIYDIVLAAHDACIAQAGPEVEYRDLHLLACRVLAEGLVDLGLLRGDPESLVEQDAHALFFPPRCRPSARPRRPRHGRPRRSGRLCPRPAAEPALWPGLSAPDRPLQAGMAVTIEPGFYQVPGILNDPARRQTYRQCVNWDYLTHFNDVRGIRIEDDVLITTEGCQVLTAALPTQAEAVAAMVSS